jgi:hypothetical protein
VQDWGVFLEHQTLAMDVRRLFSKISLLCRLDIVWTRQGLCMVHVKVLCERRIRIVI